MNPSQVMGLALLSCLPMHAHTQDFVVFKVPGVGWGNKFSLSFTKSAPEVH